MPAEVAIPGRGDFCRERGRQPLDQPEVRRERVDEIGQARDEGLVPQHFEPRLARASKYTSTFAAHCPSAGALEEDELELLQDVLLQLVGVAFKQ